MTANPNPADAVREALDLIGQYWDLAYAEGKEGRTTDTPNGDAQRTLAAIEAKLADMARLAALAAAAPDNTLRAYLHPLRRFIQRHMQFQSYDPDVGHHVPLSGDDAAMMELLRRLDFTHAPAKAREVTDADVERAFRAAEQAALRGDGMGTDGGPIRAQVRAALATFAEGES